jgi:hypothetical protein
MVKNQIEQIIEVGKHQKCRPDNFDVNGAKLLTALTLMPAIGLDFGFSIENKKVVLNIFDSNQHDDIKSSIMLDGSIFNFLKQRHLVGKVYEKMSIENLLNYETETLIGDRILWSALDYVAHNNKFSKYFSNKLLEQIEQKSIQLDAFRKVISRMNIDELDYASSFIATLLASINMYSNGSENKFERTSVNEKTFYQSLVDLDNINKAILGSDSIDSKLLDWVSARSDVNSSRSSYLSGVYIEDFQKKLLKDSSQIDVEKCMHIDFEMKLD